MVKVDADRVGFESRPGVFQDEMEGIQELLAMSNADVAYVCSPVGHASMVNVQAGEAEGIFDVSAARAADQSQELPLASTVHRRQACLDVVE